MNDDLGREFFDAVKYSMKFLFSKAPSFESKMTITDTIFASFTDEVVSKGTLMTSIAAHVRRTVFEEIVKTET